jgi:hypothetical protein
MATTTSTGTTTPATPTSEVSTLSAWAGPYVTDMLGKAKALAETPYQTYGGPLTAGASDLQSKIFQGLGSLSFPGNLGQSFTGTAPSAGVDASGNPIQGQGIVSQYMNPYLQAVLDPQLQELRRQSQITQMGNAAKAVGQGAFGGSRQALMDAETQRNLQQELNKTVGQGYASAFDKAMGQFNTEQSQARDLANMIAEQGATQRKIEQEGITADLNEFLTQRDYPQKQLQFMQSMLQNLPISTVSNVPGQQSGIGQLSSTLGGMVALVDTLKNLGIKF